MAKSRRESFFTDTGGDIDLRQYIEALFREKEQAAAALRAGTDRAIADNYARLREQLEGVTSMAGEQEKHRREIEFERAKALDAAFAAAEKAVSKAETAQLRVNDTQNEFRGALADQNRLTEATMLPRREFENQYGEVVRQLDELRDLLAKLRTDVAVGPVDLKVLTAGSNQDLGRREQTAIHWGKVAGFATFIIALIVAATGVITLLVHSL